MFLYDDLVAFWVKPCYYQTDNGTKFSGSFAWLCKRLGTIHCYITVGNSKANGQVEWTMRMLKDYIWNSFKKEPASFWMNHLALTLLLLHMTASWMTGIVPFLLASGHQLLFLSMTIPGLPSLPNQLTLDKEEAYLAEVSHIVAWR